MFVWVISLAYEIYSNSFSPTEWYCNSHTVISTLFDNMERKVNPYVTSYSVCPVGREKGLALRLKVLAVLHYTNIQYAWPHYLHLE